MFKVYCDDTLIYDPRDEDLAIISPKVSLELNKAGTFSFKMPPQHPYYELPQKMTSCITVYQDVVEIFRGRPYSQTTDFWNRKKFDCEGALAYLNDSIQRPAEYHDMTVREYLETLIAFHNEQVEKSKQFTVGIVTVTDSNDSLYRYTNYNSTMTEIKEDLIDDLGGYLKVRYENDIQYLDYLTIDDYGDTSSQVICFGENLLDFSRTIDVSDIATVVIPLGAYLEESEIEALDARLTIEDVNDGADYLQDDDAVATYGRITKVVTWDSVTTAEALLSKATAYLEDTQWENLVIEANAIDLHYADADIMQFKLGDQVRVKSRPHGLDKYFPVSAMTICLDAVSNNTITLGTDDSNTLTARTSKISSDVSTVSETINTSSIVAQAVSQATALLTHATHGYVTLNDIDDDDYPDELLIMDTPYTDTATKVWRWSLDGLGYSSTGYDGEYGTAITMDGYIVGSYIAAGTIAAEQLSQEYLATVTQEIAETVSGELEDYYTIEELKQAFTVGSGELDSIIAATYATIDSISELSSEISQLEDSITLTVSALVEEGEAADHSESGWSYSGSAGWDSDGYAYIEDYDSYIYQDIALVSGSYTLTAELSRTSGSGTATIMILYGSDTFATYSTSPVSSSGLTISKEFEIDSAGTYTIQIYNNEDECILLVNDFSVAGNVCTSVSDLAESVAELKITADSAYLAVSKIQNGESVRSYFAMDSDDVEISSGTITFDAGTVIINSDYFALSNTGAITATSGSIANWDISTYGLRSDTYDDDGYKRRVFLQTMLDEWDDATWCFSVQKADQTGTSPTSLSGLWYVTAGGNMKVGGDTTACGDITAEGQIRCSGSDYPHIYGNGNYLQLSRQNDSNYGLVIDNGIVRPASDAATNLGSSSHRWATVYASNSTISTSDARKKKDIKPLGEAALKMLDQLRPISYRWKAEACDEDGNAIKRFRSHWGLIAQEVEAALTEAGIPEEDFGALVKDPDPSTDGDWEYGLRYEEFIAPLILAVQRLRERVAALEDMGGQYEGQRNTRDAIEHGICRH